MLGVDRFDMIKGLLQKVLAFEKFLEENMDLKEKVVLIQIAVPTRSEVPECKLHFMGVYNCLVSLAQITSMIDMQNIHLNDFMIVSSTMYCYALRNNLACSN
jgi:trehalose-6-phosphate synthase